METIKSIRILIVGYGSIGKRHLRLVRAKFPEASILLYRHRHTMTIPLGATSVTSSLDEILRFGPDVAIIANPASLHLSVANYLVKIGCDILIEKPISNDLPEAYKFLETLEKHNVFCAVGYNLRQKPSLKRFKDLVLSQAVGEPISVKSEVGQYLPNWRPGTDYRENVTSSAHLGGGVMLELSHEIDYLNWIFGRPLWVSAWTGKISNLDVDVEDTAVMTLGYNRTSKCDLIVSLSMDFVRHDATRQCLVIGDKGSIKWNAHSDSVDVFDLRTNCWNRVFHGSQEHDESYIRQWDNFLLLRQIETKLDKNLATVREAVNVLEVINHARISSKNQSCKQILS